MSLDPSQSHWGPTGTHHHLQICVCNAHRHAVHDTRMDACMWAGEASDGTEYPYNCTRPHVLLPPSPRDCSES